ncbi:hypothetical protein ABPG74_000108 [Tetrahymena malaccensis]
MNKYQRSPDRFAKSYAHLSYHNMSSYSIKDNLSCTSLPQINTNQNSRKVSGKEDNENVKVAVRVRPPIAREKKENFPFISTVDVSPDNKSIVICDFLQAEKLPPEEIQEFIQNPKNYPKYSFTFDHVYDQDSTQEEVYELTAKQSVLSVLEGFNSTIFAYGQTGTGKTFTMEGFYMHHTDPNIGIIPRAMNEIFEFIENCQDSDINFMVRCSYLQIYNEVISDLLKTDKTHLTIREDKKKGIFVEDLSEWAVRNPQEVFQLIKKGNQSRATAATKMNDMSSRSHAVFIVIVEQVFMDPDNDFQPTAAKTGKLNLVDLAGSERVSITGATGQRLEECKKINQSLSALGNVISALTDKKGPRPHIPYRDSKITRILEDSLGGNCKTTMLAMISPSTDAFNHSLSTLKFANRAKNIKNCPVVNQADDDTKALLLQYESELKKLKAQLENKRKSIFDKNQILTLQVQVNQAEQDKEEALAAYEQKIEELQKEKEEKKMLEEKIKSIQSQVLVGGQKIEQDQKYIEKLEEKQKRIRSEYEKKIQVLENERRIQAEEKIEAEQYKNLLLKQRDVMVGLSQRLVERDKRIIELEEDIEVLEDCELKAQNKVFYLESILKANNIKIPDYSQIPSNITDQVDLGNQVTFNITENNLQTLVDDKSIQNKSYRQVQILRQKIEEFLSKKKKINDQELKELQDIQTIRGQYEEKFLKLDQKFHKKIEFLEKQNNEQQQSLEKFLEIINAKEKQIYNLKIALKSQIKQQPQSQEQKVDVHQLRDLSSQIKNKVDFIVDIFSNKKEANAIKLAARELVSLQMEASKFSDIIEDTFAEIENSKEQSLFKSQQSSTNRLNSPESQRLEQNNRQSFTVSQTSQNQTQRTQESYYSNPNQIQKQNYINIYSSNQNLVSPKNKIDNMQQLNDKINQNLNIIAKNSNQLSNPSVLNQQTGIPLNNNLISQPFSQGKGPINVHMNLQSQINNVQSDSLTPSHSQAYKMKQEEEDQKRRQAIQQIDSILKGQLGQVSQKQIRPPENTFSKSLQQPQYS